MVRLRTRGYRKTNTGKNRKNDTGSRVDRIVYIVLFTKTILVWIGVGVSDILR